MERKLKYLRHIFCEFNLKILFVVLSLGMTLAVSSQPMNGYYTIGGLTADYLTISSAVDSLTSNGVDGPVTFNINAGVYFEQVHIQQVTGISAINNITFQSTSLDSSSVVIQYLTSSGSNYVMYLNGVQYINIKYLTINPTGSTYQNGLLLKNGASNNTISNCVFTSSGSSANNYKALVYLYGGGLNNNQIENNRFENGGYQFRVVGSQSNHCVGNNVINNIFEGTAGKSIDIEWQDDILIDGNIMSGIRGSSSAAIEIENCYGTFLIERNKIDITGYGILIIRLNDCYGTSSDPILIRNNFISSYSTYYTVSIDLSWSSNLKIVNNSINVVGSGDHALQFGQNLENLELYNNIISCPNGGTFYTFFSTLDTLQFSSDYNAFYTISNNQFDNDGSIMNISQWQNSTALDNNSVFANPMYVSNSDLHIQNAIDINGVGLLLPEVLFDIDNDLRDSFIPDIGADEFDIDSTTYYNIELVNILFPGSNLCMPTDSIVIQVTSHSNFTIDTFNLQWWMFEILRESLIVTTPITPGDTIDVLIDQYSFTNKTFYEFDFEISYPNGHPDNDFNDNTLSGNYYYLNDVEIFQLSDSICNNNIELYIKTFPLSTVLWSNGSTQSKIIIFSPGIYSVTVTDENGCQVSDSIIVY